MQAQHSATTNRESPIVVVGPCATRHKGGVAYFTSHLVAALAASSPVEFITWQEIYPKWMLRREVSLPHPSPHESPHESLAKPLLRFSNPGSWRRTAKSIVALAPRSIVLNWVHPIHAPIYAYLLQFFKRRSRAQRIIVCHNVMPHERFFGDATLVRVGLRSASQLIVHSEQEAERARSLFPDVPVRTLEMPSFSMPERSVPGERCDAVRLLYFGAIRAYKGVDILLTAMQKLRDALPGCSLTIAGEPFGQYGELLRAQVEALQLERVTLDFRYIPEAEIGELFAAATVVVLPFREVTQSASLSLALSSPLPVVTTDLPALRGCIEESDCIWTAAPEDANSLAQAIIAAAGSGSYRTRFRPIQESWKRYAEGLQ